MSFPNVDIEPLVAIFIYDIKGNNIFQLEHTISEFEKNELSKYFIHPIEFYQWVRRYNEITIFRGRFRATYITFVDITLLFVSRVENIVAEVRPKILQYIKILGENLINAIDVSENKNLVKIIFRDLSLSPTQMKLEVEKIFSRSGIEKPIKVPIQRQVQTVQQQNIEKVQAFEKIKPFETIPQISKDEMTQEIISDANKRAVTSLLFSSIRGCNSPAAAAYIYPKYEGTMGELYAGNLEEKKIVYVLETLTKFPRVIHEMVNSKEEIKFLNAEIIQIIVEDCSDGKILIGMTTNIDDVISVAYKFKIIKQVLHTMGF
ncbi:MAG: hypothetical protein ACTSX6_03445 [Candidatus Heimdallarchaeaceae archaeon]